jgi:hypothetical protein
MAKTKGKAFVTTSNPEVNPKYQDPYEHKTYDFIPAKEPGRMNTNPNSPGFVHDTTTGPKGGLEYVQGIGYLGQTLASRDTVIGYERNAGGPPRRLTTEDRRSLYEGSRVAMQTPAVYIYGFGGEVVRSSNGPRNSLAEIAVDNNFEDMFLFMNVSPGSATPEWRRIPGLGQTNTGLFLQEDINPGIRAKTQSVIDTLRNNGTNIGQSLSNLNYFISRYTTEWGLRSPIISRGFNFSGNSFMLVKERNGKLYITPFSVGVQTQDDVAINVAGMREYVNNFTGTRASQESWNEPSIADAREKAMNPVNTWVKQTGFQAPSPLAPTKGSKGLLGNCSTAGQVVTGLVVGGAIFALYKTCKK